MIENKNALHLTMGWWWWWGERIKVVRNRVYPRAAADDNGNVHSICNQNVITFGSNVIVATW